jgi:orotidine-5'-phosphate decarboxylase
LVLGVTVLTSVKGKVEKEVVRLAKVAQQCGLDGVISSPREIFAIRKKLGAHFMVVTPGVRPAWAPAPGDQGRVMTPAEAVAAGANCIVVGRPIIEAEKPSAAALRITTEMASVGM